MKRKKSRDRLAPDAENDIGRMDWDDDDSYLEDFEERVRRPRFEEEDDNWMEEVEEAAQFDLERWREDLARRSSHRQRIRNNDIRRGIWGSMGS